MAQDKFYKEVEKIVAKCDSPYIRKDKEGHYYFDIYVERGDFDDFDETVAKIIRKKDFKSKDDFIQHINEYIYEAYIEVESEYYSDICDFVEGSIDPELYAEYGEDFDYLRECVQDIVYSNYEDVFRHVYATSIRCYVALTNTNEEMNYDFYESVLENDMKYSDFNSLHNSNKFLCKSQGHTMKELYDTLYKDKKSSSKFINSLIEEYANAYYGGCFVFLFELDLEDYANIKYNKPKLMISKNTLCGLYDWVDGGGGTLDVELEKDLVVPSAVYEMFEEGEMGYGIDETFGLTGNAWRQGSVKYQLPPKKNKK